MAFSATRMLMAAGFSGNTPPPFVVNAAFFDNASSALSVDCSALSNSTSGILSVWVRFTAIGGGGANLFGLNITASAKMLLSVSGAGAVTLVLRNNSGNGYTISGATIGSGIWKNLLLSWQTSTTTGTLTVNGSGTGSVSGFTGLSVPYAANTPLVIGANPASSTPVNGCISEVYFAPGQFLDFTNSSNVALFYSGSGHPVNLGSNGQAPTGTAPAVYWHGLYTDLTNLGSLGGSFTASGTALTACASTP
jgi:hypothetical protein